ncbi:MAG: hypothetical protein IRZ31_07650 [Thermogemmatispora sp.]|uniref:hypothetical protein n=1 Tax=Thermogemmatispora sp. TaxID=1968838 RepID=UPI002608588D|nr:hypothetical protein [Thermogemmatispora sp.]MBX5456761.1 hypothetical protein [Thermogemmatispora sp.]
MNLNRYWQRALLFLLVSLSLLLSFTITSPARAASLGSTPDRLPPGECLTLSMWLRNPQLDVIEVHTSVLNLCGSLVQGISIDWTTDVTCNGRQYPGPAGSFYAGTLAPNRSWRAMRDFSAICWGDFPPYLPVPYTIRGSADAFGYMPRHHILVLGHYDTPSYRFL